MLIILLLVLSSACKPSVKITVSDARTNVVNGYKIIVPWEESSDRSIPGEYIYNGESVKFKISENRLIVNNTNFGAVKVGDTINLLRAGEVVVNEELRSPGMSNQK